MTKEFIPYQQALALKELGFDEPCFAFYKDTKISGCKYPDEDSQFDVCTNTQMKEYKNSDKYCSAPLYQQAFRFFREKYDLQHEIYYLDDLIKNGYKITDTSTNTELTEFQYKHNYFELGGYDFEEAELECLKKLIEIVKDGKSKSNS